MVAEFVERVILALQGRFPGAILRELGSRLDEVTQLIVSVLVSVPTAIVAIALGLLVWQGRWVGRAVGAIFGLYVLLYIGSPVVIAETLTMSSILGAIGWLLLRFIAWARHRLASRRRSRGARERSGGVPPALGIVLVLAGGYGVLAMQGAGVDGMPLALVVTTTMLGVILSRGDPGGSHLGRRLSDMTLCGLIAAVALGSLTGEWLGGQLWASLVSRDVAGGFEAAVSVALLAILISLTARKRPISVGLAPAHSEPSGQARAHPSARPTRSDPVHPSALEATP